MLIAFCLGMQVSCEVSGCVDVSILGVLRSSGSYFFSPSLLLSLYSLVPMPLPPPADSSPPFPFSPLTLPISSRGYLPSSALLSSSSSYAAGVDRVEACSGVASVCRPDSVVRSLPSIFFCSVYC
jgi:hypothetical protein